MKTLLLPVFCLLPGLGMVLNGAETGLGVTLAGAGALFMHTLLELGNLNRPTPD